VKKARRAGPHLLRHPQWSEGKPCNHSVPGGVQMAFMWVEQARACLAVARPERRCQVDDRYPDLPAPRAGRAHAANSPRKRLTGCRDVPRRTGPASAQGAVRPPAACRSLQRPARSERRATGDRRAVREARRDHLPEEPHRAPTGERSPGLPASRTPGARRPAGRAPGSPGSRRAPREASAPAGTGTLCRCRGRSKWRRIKR
jgi:hypothetical protein